MKRRNISTEPRSQIVKHNDNRFLIQHWTGWITSTLESYPLMRYKRVTSAFAQAENVVHIGK